MKYSDLTEEMRNEMISVIQDKLLKLGIKAEVNMGAKTIYDGREMVYVNSKQFNTTPVIYKFITIDGQGFIKNTEKENRFSLSLSLSYRFKYFDGGENGVNIGIIEFVIFPETERVASLGLTI